jgi:ABC-type uncharacterized transport system ATPase subunit
VTGLDTLKRAQAARLLAQLQETRAIMAIAEDMAFAEDGWHHPATLERIERAQALERALVGLLTARAPAPRPPAGL